MLLANSNATDDTVSMGMGKATDYGMKTNSKAFTLMTDGLYQNKIGSCVREVSCNAADSHAMAGKGDVPFIIHLPDSFEPYFSVRDIGLGMSDEAVRVNFCTLFLSTKDTSNEAVGAFGLGSKTPFAYTDSFTITSVYEGVRTVYVASLGAGMPTVTEMSREETTDENGVEIQFAVLDADFHRFAHETREQLRWFPVKPIIENGRGFEWHNMPTYFKTIGKIAIRNDYAKTFVTQGGVGYPLQFDLVKDALSTAEQIQAKSLMDKRGLVLQFNIGDIEVTPSREGISYKYETIQNIANAFKEACAVLHASTIADLNALPNDWQRAAYINDGGTLVAAIVKESVIKDSLIFSFSAGGHCDFNFNAFKDTRKVTAIKVEDGKDITVTNDIPYMKYSVQVYSTRGRTERVSRSTLSTTLTIRYSSDVVFFYADTCVASVSRIRKYTRENINKTVYVISHFQNHDTQANIDEVSACFGGVDVVRVSTLPRPERATSDRSGYKIAKLWQIDNEFCRSTKNLTAIYDPIKELDGGYYLTSHSSNVNAFSGNYNRIILLNALLQSGTIDQDVFVIRENDVKRIEGNENWIPVDQYLDTVIKNVAAQSHKLDKFKLAFESAVSDANFTNLDYSVLAGLSDCGMSDKVYKRWIHYAKNNKRCEYTSKINPVVAAVATIDSSVLGDVKVLKDAIVEKLNAVNKAFTEKYPLLQMMEQRYNAVLDHSKFMAHLALYVKAVNMLSVDSSMEVR